MKEQIKSSTSEKLYQQQILKLKTLKGVTTEGQPSRKDNGYLSIEKSGGVYCLVFRSFLGQYLFAGIIYPTLSKVKELSPSEHSNGKNKHMRLKAKAVVMVKNGAKAEMEHVELSFLSAVDRTLFI